MYNSNLSWEIVPAFIPKGRHENPFAALRISRSLSELEILRLGYKVLCAHCDSKRYKNIYQIEGKLHFVW